MGWAHGPSVQPALRSLQCERGRHPCSEVVDKEGHELGSRVVVDAPGRRQHTVHTAFPKCRAKGQRLIGRHLGCRRGLARAEEGEACGDGRSVQQRCQSESLIVGEEQRAEERVDSNGGVKSGMHDGCRVQRVEKGRGRYGRPTTSIRRGRDIVGFLECPGERRLVGGCRRGEGDRRVELGACEWRAGQMVVAI